MFTVYKVRQYRKLCDVGFITGLIFCCLTISIVFAGTSTESGSDDVASVKGRGGSITIEVDPRVELMSIIFRLAGNPEYNKGKLISYLNDVDKQFGSFRSHSVVKLAARLRAKFGVSYDAPMSLAVHFKDANSLDLRVPIYPHPECLDARWHEAELRDFLGKAGKFAQETNFADFFRDHNELYTQTEAKLQDLLDKEGHFGWFDKFFGASTPASFHVVIGFVNGPCCYGPRIKLEDKQEFYCILGVWKCGFMGLGSPQFDKDMLSTVVHEFCHSYANPIVDSHVAELKPAGERIFPSVKKKMERAAYGNWQTMMYESLVRACVVRYLYKNAGAKEAEKQIASDVAKGFLWIRELSDLLGQYESERDKYNTLDAFFPKIKEFFDNYELP